LERTEGQELGVYPPNGGCVQQCVVEPPGSESTNAGRAEGGAERRESPNLSLPQGTVVVDNPVRL